jgi:hypothetical protein
MPRLSALNDWLAGQLPDTSFSLAQASADASFRRYFRATLADGTTRVVMDAPPEHEDCKPFIHVAALLKDLKMREYEPTFAWETTAPSEKQRQVIERFNIKCPATKGEATMLMNKLFARSRDKLASVAQVRWLHRLNHPSPETATNKEAKAFLDLKWKKPA